MKKLITIATLALCSLFATAQDNEYVTVDQSLGTKQVSTDVTVYLAKAHGYTTDGTLVAFTLACATNRQDCRVLEPGQYTIIELPPDDSNGYHSDKMTALSFRLIGKTTSSVYFVLETLKKTRPVGEN